MADPTPPPGTGETPEGSGQPPPPGNRIDWKGYLPIGLIATGLLSIVVLILLWAIGNVDDNVGRLTERVHKVDDKVQTLSREVGSVKSEVGSIKDDVDQLKTRSRNIETQVQQLGKDVGYIKGQLSVGSSTRETDTPSLTSAKPPH